MLKNLVKNRKANFQIVLLVFLVLLTIVVSLFLFSTSTKKIKIGFYDTQVINKVNVKKNLASFYIQEIIKTSLIESYYEVLREGRFIEKPSSDMSEIPEFGNLKKTLNEDFKEIFRERFRVNFLRYPFEEDYLKELKANIYNNEFYYDFNGEVLEVNIPKVRITEFSDKINVTSLFNLSFIVGVERDLGVDTLYGIYNTKEECKTKKSQDSLVNCFNNGLRGFNASVVEITSSTGQKYFVVTLVTTKKFLINGELKELTLKFISV